MRGAARVDRERETEMALKLMARVTATVLTSVLALMGSAAASAATPQGSDLGPVGWSSGSGDPNLGVLNDGTRTLNLDGGWRFKLVNTASASDPTGTYGTSADPKADAPGFDDASWQQLTLPHDWSITQAPDPSQSNATGFFPGGLGWYRKTFTLPASMAGKRISLDFDGVFENSYVYLNGRLLGNHPYGYTGYSYDLSGLVHTDGHTPNVLAVVVQNQEPNSRWNSGRGMTRHVHLTVANPLHIARWGTPATTPDLATTITSHSPPCTWRCSWPTTAARPTPSTSTTWSGTPPGIRWPMEHQRRRRSHRRQTSAADLRLGHPHRGRPPPRTSTRCGPP